jgi:pimeloyl-ACP methyl ester carboxylesterase
MPKVLSRGINFHYQARGEGPDIVLLHGVTSSLAAWYNGILVALAADGFRVTAYDLRGHGLSESTVSGYSSLEMAADLVALLDTLGIGQVMLAGHSFGGALAMHFALLHPDRTRGIVLLDSGLACLRHLRIIQDWGGWKTPGLREEGFTPEWFQAEDGKDDMSEFLVKGLSAPRLNGFKKGQAGLTPRLKKLLEETRVGSEMREVAGLTEDRLKEIEAPVLALYGATSPNRKMAAHLGAIMPNCAPVTLEGVGHFAVMHDPHPFLHYMKPFFHDPLGFVQTLKPGASPDPNGAVEAVGETAR